MMLMRWLEQSSRRTGRWLVALAIFVVAVGATDDARAAELQTLEIATKTGVQVFSVEVATTEEEKRTGLMYRKEMPAHEGMLFVFEQPSQQCFWMKNTLLPLSVAFVADDGTIVNIEEMAPQTLDSHCSQKPVRYVLEMNKGWFARKGIKPGSKLTGAPFQRQ